MVEVDASSSGGGAVLSQRQPDSSKVHPCTFFTRKLTPAETNYNMRHWELLSIKAALEEWRHWLEGTHHLFLVLIDHRNLAYLREAKCLNPRQARWTLFFTRFRFSVSYCPGSKNEKADALSHMHETLEPPACSDPILPPSVLIAPVQWDIMEEIEQAQSTEAPRPTCPTSKAYVPSDLWHRVMQMIHSGPSSGHPGVQRTAQLIGFWWPALCHHRTSQQLPEGLLEPLPISQWPWLHISIDFLTYLPKSQAFTTVVVVIDRFSKSCKSLPLKSLPTAMEIFENVFRHYGLPEDIVSDRGPQFTSQVWSEFCKQLGIRVNLSSGYYPQSNGQVERLNQELGRFLQTYCSKEQHWWSEFLPWALKTHSAIPPRAFLLFNVSWAINPYCSHGQENHQLFPQLMIGRSEAKRSGRGPMFASRGPSDGRKSKQTVDAALTRDTKWLRKSGLPLRIWDLNSHVSAQPQVYRPFQDSSSGEPSILPSGTTRQVKTGCFLLPWFLFLFL